MAIKLACLLVAYFLSFGSSISLFYGLQPATANSRSKLLQTVLGGAGEAQSTNKQCKKEYEAIAIDKDGFLDFEFEVFNGEEVENMICRQVPGDGNCLFHAMAVGLGVLESGVHPKCDRTSLWDRSTWLRKVAVEYLEEDPDREIYIEGDEKWNASVLLDVAAQQYATTPAAYCRAMRTPSGWGGGEEKWGGGPEIVALANLLGRPVHVYELMCRGPRFCLHRIACFGSPLFDDKVPLHVLSADSRFPEIKPGRQAARGSHFLALIPVSTHQAALQKQKEEAEKRKVALQESPELWGSVQRTRLKFQSICGGFARSLLYHKPGSVPSASKQSTSSRTNKESSETTLSIYDVL